MKKNNINRFDSAGIPLKIKKYDGPKLLEKYNFKTEKEVQLDTVLIKCTDRRCLPGSNLRKIQNVSFPRSGHALLRRCLQLYFRDRLRFCEYYTGCRKSPCVNPQTNYQKNHDFDLRLENNLNQHYIIQYRHPIESIISFYKHSLNIKSIRDDTKESWIKFYKNNVVYWKKFIEKWLINNRNSNTLIVLFDDLINNSEERLKGVITYMDPGNRVDEKRIREIIKELRISKRGSVESFKYYDAECFKEMEESVKEELKRTKLKEIFS